MVPVSDCDLQASAGAGAMALDIARIASEHAVPGMVTAHLADYLAASLPTDAVAIFVRRTKPLYERSRPYLHLVGLSGHSSPPTDDVRARRLKAVAYRALIRSRPISLREGWASTGDAAASTRQMLAMPLGGVAPCGCLVVERRVHAGGQESADLVHLLAQLAPSLSLAVRQACESEEALDDDRRSSHRRTLFSVTSEAILGIGQDFAIREANPAFERLMGWPESAIVGMPCTHVLKCRDERKALLCGTARCPVMKAFAADAEGEQSVCDLSWEMRSGRRCDLSASVAVQHSPEGAEAVIVARDVTALNGANRMRASFISMVSHELRTPLNSVNGFLEIVADGQVGPLNERQLEFLTYARGSTQQLITLVEDILFISKADSGLFTLRESDVEVGKLVHQAAQAMQAAAEKAQVSIACTVAPDVSVIRGDELRVQQVLTNLLGNAIKFSPAESVIDLRVERKGSDVVFSVADQGPGVPLEDHGRIFERFYQSESAVREGSGGYGLGLAIAKLIVEHHGGRIWVESALERGATFYFTLPAS